MDTAAANMAATSRVLAERLMFPRAEASTEKRAADTSVASPESYPEAPSGCCVTIFIDQLKARMSVAHLVRSEM